MRDSMMKAVHVLGSFVWVGVLIVFLLLLVVNSGYLLWGMSEVVPGIMNQDCPDCVVMIYVLTPAPWVVFEFSEPLWFLSYYLSLVIIIIISIILAVLLDGKRLVADMVASVRDGRLSLSTKSSWAIIGQLFCVYLFFYMTYLFILWLFGVEAATPENEGPLWYLMYQLANASVYEEIVTRLLFLGLPMLAIAIGIGVRGKSLFKEFLGGSGRMTASTWALIAVSASIFGLAHIPHWDIYKLVPTFFAGIILGFVYVKRGIWASILFHFIVDYYGASVIASSEVGHLGIIAFLVLALIVFAVAGLFFFVYYARKALKHLMPLFGGPEPVPMAALGKGRAPMAQPQQTRQPLGFQCQRCGFQEARYLDGKYHCLRCGHIQ